MKEKTIVATDRITLLPDFIVHHILSCLLDDPKSRVRMSVLSKRWFALTASFPILYFRQDTHSFSSCSSFSSFSSFPGKYANNEYIKNRFYKYVEYTVSRFCEQNISAHTLDICADFMNLGQVKIFGHCLDLVLEKGLQVMDIQFDYNHEDLPMFRLPNTLLSASLLTSLTLHKCELPSSLMVDVVKFKSLRLLSLTFVPIDEGMIEYLTNGCPLLEEICLSFCYGSKTFCVKRHYNLQKVEISSNTGLERIDVDAPNLIYFLFESNKYTDKPPSVSLDSCTQLTTFCYRGFPFKRFSDFLSNFPFLENVSLDFPSPVNNLTLSNHSLRKIRLISHCDFEDIDLDTSGQSHCDLEEIDLNTPGLLLFEYYDQDYGIGANIKPFSRNHSMSKGCMKYVTSDSLDILWYQKCRQFMEKSSIFKVLKLAIYYPRLIDSEDLKLIQLPPYELEHVKLTPQRWRTPLYVALVDVVLRCFRPRSLTLKLDSCSYTSHVAKYTYEKLLQQEDEGRTNIKFVVLISSSKDEQHFSDLNSILEALSIRKLRCKITFIKEEVVQKAG